MMPLYPYATKVSEITLSGYLERHGTFVMFAIAAVLVILWAVIGSALSGETLVQRGTGQILGITPEHDGWAMVDLWFRDDLVRVRTRDHGRPTFSVGEPILVFHATDRVGSLRIDSLRRLA